MTISPKIIVRLMILAAFGPAILFLASGDLAWTMGWVLAIFSFAYTLFSRLAILRKSPSLFTERFESLKKDNVEPWDRALVPLIGIALPTATMIVAGLDRRFRWSPEMPLWTQLAAFALMAAGSLFALWAALENRFFSAVVRIQAERGHTVVTTGPYRYIRHPGYSGGLLFHLFLPFALGTLWALVPVFATITLTVVRTSLEDRMLIRKLEGYKEYTERTRRRLVPGIW